MAHGLEDDLADELDRAIREGMTLDEFTAMRPGLELSRVHEDMRHEVRSPVAAVTTAGTRLEAVLAIDPFSQGRWLVETCSGSRHIFDLDLGIYRRIPAKPSIDIGIDNDWYDIARLEPWPSVNSVFTIDLWPVATPQTEEEGRGTEEALEGSLTSAWVTRIVRLDVDDSPDLAPLMPGEALTQAPPRSTWILMASEDSALDGTDLDDPEGVLWTVPKLVQRGDLALIYYMAPTKAVLYAGRIQSPPVYEDPFLTAADRARYPKHWWAEVNALTELEPILFATLRGLFNGQLILRGKPGVYVPPPVVQAIRDVQGPDPERLLVIQVPTDPPSYPGNRHLTLAEWSRLGNGNLLLEAHVERYVVEPFLRLLTEVTPGTSYVAKAPLGRLVPDYSLLLDGELSAIVEVKLGIRGQADGRKWAGPDVDQVLRYCSRGDVPGILIDANRVLLFKPKSPEPVAVIERTLCNQFELGLIQRHVFPSCRTPLQSGTST